MELTVMLSPKLYGLFNVEWTG